LTDGKEVRRGSEKIFWRSQAIGSLVEYPEKTDWLVQRQAAGKTLGRAFYFKVALDPN
jgi:hypothetical protein